LGIGPLSKVNPATFWRSTGDFLAAQKIARQICSPSPAGRQKSESIQIDATFWQSTGDAMALSWRWIKLERR